MDYEVQLKVQAFLDGELPEPEAREIAALVARDPEATALLTEFRHTRKALADFEGAGPKVPESREFYWSKIAREIERREPASPVVESVSLFGRLRRVLMPASAIAALVIVALIAGRMGPAAAPDTEMTMADSSTFTYNDEANGTTLVWLSYPAER
jgi:anti-sigma factor RsiW